MKSLVITIALISASPSLAAPAGEGREIDERVVADYALCRYALGRESVEEGWQAITAEAKIRGYSDEGLIALQSACSLYVLGFQDGEADAKRDN